jgi:lipoprotein-anchoring transpeptidase ErfK/SrfK
MSRLLAFASVLTLAACGAPDPEAPAGSGAPAVRATPALFTPQQIEQATIAAQSAPAAPTAPPAEGAAPAPARPDAGLIRLQILLDRTAFSPGIIDGLPGENTRQAIAAFREANHLGDGDAADQALLDRLAQADAGPVMTAYVLTAADVAGPFSPPPPEDVAAQARTGANYSSPRERLAERFHVTEELLQALNPAATFRAGERIVVPAVSQRSLAEVTRIVVDKDERSVRAFDASGTLVAFYPATIGSSDMPTPSGTLRVLGVANEPDYAYDPAKLSYAKGTERVVVPAGPNNPVGSVWIDLSKDTYGIHGTPEPSKIAKTASHGCVRLTNWDVEELAAAVKPGVQVRFV